MTYDIAIIGAGIFGLALARQLAGEGKSVLLLDAGDIGGKATNASAGLLGALMPPSSLVNGPLAAVQLRCLSRYKQHIIALEAETRLQTGYRMSGRVQPILTEQALAQFTQQHNACATSWVDFPATDHLRIVARAELSDKFSSFAPQLADAPYGYAVDHVSAQVTPRLLLATLATSIAGRVTLQPKTRVLHIADGEVVTAGATYRAQQVIVTAGWQTGALVPAAPIVGVKGQACAVPFVLKDTPLLYTRNGYVVFHDAFTALGSTTETHWVDTVADAGTCESLQARAAELMPALATLSITECWAGLRPKSSGALPYIARIDERTLVASGGYKVGLALAFEIAAWIADALNQNAFDPFWSFVFAKENLAIKPPAADMLNMTAT